MTLPGIALPILGRTSVVGPRFNFEAGTLWRTIVMNSAFHLRFAAASQAQAQVSMAIVCMGIPGRCWIVGIALDGPRW
jgi:hypothetical protein